MENIPNFLVTFVFLAILGSCVYGLISVPLVIIVYSTISVIVWKISKKIDIFIFFDLLFDGEIDFSLISNPKKFYNRYLKK